MILGEDQRFFLPGSILSGALLLSLTSIVSKSIIRSQPRVFSDETRLPRLDLGRKRTKVCQLWAQAVDDRPWKGPAPPAVGYIFSESRSAVFGISASAFLFGDKLGLMFAVGVGLVLAGLGLAAAGKRTSS